MSEPSTPATHTAVYQRFQDQLDANNFAEAFLLQQSSRYEPLILKMRWWNLEADDGRVGGLYANGKIVASVTVTRDTMNWSEVCGVAFDIHLTNTRQSILEFKLLTTTDPKNPSPRELRNISQ